MNRFILSMVLYMGTSCMAFAQFGTYTASEMQSYIDKETGVEITVLTDTARNDRFCIRQIRCGPLMENIYCSVLRPEGMTRKWNVGYPMVRYVSSGLPRFTL